MDQIFTKIIEAENQALDIALCIITKVDGSTPRKAGSKMLVYSNGNIFGSVGGGSLENKVITDALEIITRGDSSYFKYDLLKDFSMGCGGFVEIYIEPLVKAKKLYIFGAGHIGKELALQANKIGFNVTLVDERDSIFENFDHKGVNKINKKHAIAFKELVFDENVFIASITHKHAYDYEVVGFCAKQEFAYLGMIGSKRKI